MNRILRICATVGLFLLHCTLLAASEHNIDACPSQTIPANGELMCTEGNSAGSICSFTCSDGFVLTGVPNMLCVVGASDSPAAWTAETPQCIRMEGRECQPAYEADRTRQVICSNSNQPQSICLIICNTGFSQAGQQSVVCQENGEWSNLPSTCETVPNAGCRPEVTRLTNGESFCSSGSDSGSTCLFRCHSGFALSGAEQITCSERNTWTHNPPVCVTAERRKCGVLTSPAHGLLKCSDSNTRGSVCRVECEAGYRVVGFADSVCREDGEWSNPASACQRVMCERLPAPTHGYIDCTSLDTFTGICSFECVEGYGLVGASTVTCKAHGKWSHRPPVCREMRCEPAHTAPSHGSIRCTSENNIGSVCKFSCDDGFRLVGPSAYLNCLGDVSVGGARWDRGRAPVCQSLAPITSTTTTTPTKTSVLRRESRFSYWMVCLLHDNPTARQSCFSRVLLLCTFYQQC